MSAWIDCAKHLPDDDITVIIALDDGEVWTGYHSADEDGWCYVTSCPLGARVTHWMHLPPAPAVRR